MSEAELIWNAMTKLDSSINNVRRERDELRKQLTASLAREREMRRALEPLKKRCEDNEQSYDDTERPDSFSVSVTLGELRALRNALASPAPSDDGEHDWFVPDAINYTCCRKCGIVRRTDGKNKPCRGHVAISLRDEETTASPAPSSGDGK